jgi:hypothetical protein
MTWQRSGESTRVSEWRALARASHSRGFESEASSNPGREAEPRFEFEPVDISLIPPRPRRYDMARSGESTRVSEWRVLSRAGHSRGFDREASSNPGREAEPRFEFEPVDISLIPPRPRRYDMAT